MVDVIRRSERANGPCLRPPVRDLMPVLRVEADDVTVGRRVEASGLIQQVDGIELPAPGIWSIMAHQRLEVSRPWAFRGSPVETVAGTLDVDDGRLDVIMSFVARSRNGPAYHVGYSGRLTDADRSGRWRFDGSAIVDGHAIPKLRIAVTYFGVYDHGAAPVTLLQLRVRYRHPRMARRLHGLLNARRTVKIADIETCGGAGQVDAGRHVTPTAVLTDSDIDECVAAKFPVAGSTARKPLGV